MEWHIIGIAASFLTTFGFVPQIVKMHRAKSAKDVSLVTLLQFGAGNILWALYGVYLKNLIIMTANIITFITIIVAIAFYYHYNREHGLLDNF
ncbi:MAG: hypothetical protein FIB08_05600 [Candidatus Methanoperedens sp.]|nr:hypothetical protein [Candidatus Methanoperedens sp.]